MVDAAVRAKKAMEGRSRSANRQDIASKVLLLTSCFFIMVDVFEMLRTQGDRKIKCVTTCAVSTLSLNELTVRKIASVRMGINIKTTDLVPFVIAWIYFHGSVHLWQACVH